LERLGIRDTTNLIVVSDHGMAEVARSQAIDLKRLLSGLDTVALQWSGTAAGFAVALGERETALTRLAGPRVDAASSFEIWREIVSPTRCARRGPVVRPKLDGCTVGHCGFDRKVKKAGYWGGQRPS